MSFEATVDDPRQMPDDGRRTSNDYNSSSLANGSGELEMAQTYK